MKVNCYRWTCLLFCFLAATLFAQENPQIQNPKPVQEDSAQSTVFSDTSSASLTQTSNGSQEDDVKWSLNKTMPWLVALVALLFGIYQYRKRVQDTAKIEKAKLKAKDDFDKEKKITKTKTAEQHYRDALQEELGSIKILGSPDIESVPVNLLDAFVSVDLSETLHSESRFDPKKMKQPSVQEKHTNPENVLKRAFQNYRLLLLIGDPGSGKTTLMKYYAISCLQDQEYKKFGFKERVLPLYFPLRELEPNDATPDSLPENLTRWAKNHALVISAEEFYNWLHERPTLVLLDGLDEISDLEQRKRVCKWIDNTCAGLKKARFVVTSRWTGYRKVDGIELGFDHMRADVRDFSKEQQEDFLTKWFRAVFQRNYTEEGEPSQEWLERQVELADKKVETIVSFIDKNKSLRSLSAVPMLLQIMAILWQERDILPQSRSELYNASLNYLLDFRDKRRQLLPVLDADKARRVLSPIALWMQGTLTKDEAPKLEMHEQMQPILNTLEKQPEAEVFCKNLIDRAGLLADYGETDYIFRHKSFREYLAGVQITKEDKRQEWLKRLVSHFGDDWWEEPLRFFISEADAEMFDNFMAALFRSQVSEDMDQKQQNLLQSLVREAPQKKIDALSKKLRGTKTTIEQQRYILECLKTMNTPEALNSVEKFVSKADSNDANLNYAREILSSGRHSDIQETGTEVTEKRRTISDKSFSKTLLTDLPIAFRNPYEEQAEYLLIPSGEFKYSVSEKNEQIPNIYFARHPVTNKRYRRFVAYLENKLPDVAEILHVPFFLEKLLEFASSTADYEDYLGGKTADKMRAKENSNKRFNQADQPVVSISWFAARAYCFWLSCLQTTQDGDPKLQDVDKIAEIYRLPTELEWEWAAAGRVPDGSLREYPWPKEKGEPNEKLANYGSHVDATTPVGRYPDGATPEGLMNMAGNVWEWMENPDPKYTGARALRGGSWGGVAGVLRCSGRDVDGPGGGGSYVGFRVVRPQSKI